MKKMKIKLKKLMATAFAFSGLLLGGNSVFAAGNSYNISYNDSKAELLGASHVAVKTGLNHILTSDKSQITFSGSKWIDGYHMTGNNCKKVKYFKVYGNDTPGLSYQLKEGSYRADVTINKVEVTGISGLSEGGKFSTVMVETEDGSSNENWLYVGTEMYTDSKCTTKLANYERPTIENDAVTFVETNIKLYKDSKIYNSEQLYFGIIDFDSAQSFKILNSDNKLVKGSMYVMTSADDLQGSSKYKNMYSPDGYLYSTYDNDGFLMTGKSDIYVQLTTNTQNNGINAVFGFAANAGSAVDFKNLLYRVTYVSDEYGEITGKKSENVEAGSNPTSSTQKPNEGYEFTHWTVDKDVTLTDGKTVIKAGEAISEAQIKQVVVNENLEFKAFHKPVPVPEEKGPAAPNTGASTGEFNATPIVISVFGITLGALFVRLLPRLTHKKIKFN